MTTPPVSDLSTVYLTGFDAGLRVGTVDRATGAIDLTGALPEVDRPSFLAGAADGRILYATNELDHGTVTALDVGKPQRPAVLARRSSQGAQPTHVSVHPSGRYLLTANYGSGSVVVHPLHGGLGEPTDVVRHHTDANDPHAHQVLTDPSGQWVLAVDLGADSVYRYRLDLDTGRLGDQRRFRLPAGAGPRHLVFHPNGRHAYLLGELRAEITVLAWDHDAGDLTPGQVVPTSADSGSTHPAEILVSADGRFVYASNRGENTIALFTVTAAGAQLTHTGSVPCGGDWPRHCVLSRDERWLYVANERSNLVTWLPRDPATGALGEPAGSIDLPGACMVLP